ncbi:undecaprenyl-phosphate glucose phosphotransferase [Catalinimonas niigatensis]|uniref:undecaprenyl-phosphate glucose phosphotransferase n=1 Tax=Catalinimonas niigatensis TaxID=1397264 RepID=UPI002666718A|nr:undecaprenyl-phosphate glucose phosphotransferase [Catalinimonas niigatensis]WPP53334.1 undecaprenyl-phosphate glucose phosphotransferase [Catalinimonas niigatensis]
MPHKRSKYLKVLFSLGDFVILNLSFIGAYFAKFHTIDGLAIPPYLELWILVNIFWGSLTLIFKPYNIDRTTKLNEILKKHYALVVIHLLMITAFWVFNKAYYYSRAQLLITFLLFLVSISVWRLIFVYTLGILRAKGYNIRKVVVVGHQKTSSDIVKHFYKHPEYGYRVIKTFGQNEKEEYNLNGKLEEIKRYVIQNDIDEVYCCMPYMDFSQLKSLVDFGHESLIKVKLIGNFQGLPLNGIKSTNYGSIPVINATSIPLDDWRNKLSKRIFDIVFSFLVVLCIFTWLIPVIAIIIKFTSRGPVFFKQKRTGLNNNIFECWKFRTMYVNDESDAKQATKNDSRVTPIGRFLRKTSLDELPQFFNVLLGNMSVVGPRPHPVQLNEQYTPQIRKFAQRHSVKPGITGLAQAKGYRGETATFEKMNNRVRLDRFYVEKWFFSLDLKIIVLTIFSLAKGQENAY